MLENIWEGQEATFLGHDVTDVLHARAVLLASEYVTELTAVYLLVADAQRHGIRLLAEGKSTLGDVRGVIIVKSCCTDVFILVFA